MDSLQPSSGFNVNRTKEEMSTEKSREQVVQRKSFSRPPERVVKSCRAQTGRPIANDSETSRQREKVSHGKCFKNLGLWFF
jgi:hypothetical protein